MTLEEIAKQIECRYQEQLNRCGLMCRLFSRAKTVASIEHKLFDENSTYLKGTSKIQDIIGIRIVVYFSDDVEVAELLVNNHHVVKRAIDAPDSCTFRPQRLNITCNMSPEFVKDFRAGLPEKYAQYIDDTYEVQVRTIFSEGWHEVEHDLRYKCKETWVGYENYSRTLNGVIASLENAEWSMQSIFRSMAQDNFNRGDFSSMLRNKLRIRLKGNNLSPELETYLKKTPDTARALFEMDRTVFLLSLLCHTKKIELNYDNVLFLINRMWVQDMDLMSLESENIRASITEYFND